MNKTEFINKLSSELSYSKEDCTIINDILESNFFISRKNKDKILDALMQKLNIDHEEAERIYEASAEILKDGLIDKLKHPFRDQD